MSARISASLFGAALALISTATEAEELAIAGAGTQRCQWLNENAVPGRGADPTFASRLIFTWVQGYMSGFNMYSLGINRGSNVNLGAVSTEVQWEYIVSHCRTHPADYIVQARPESASERLKK